MKKAKSIIFLILPLLFFIFLVNSKTALAGGAAWGSQVGMSKIGVVYGDQNPTDIRYTIVKIINIALSFLGILCLVLIIFAGFKWMTAGGNEDQVSSAKKILKNAVIGLLIILVSWSVTIFIMVRMNAIAKKDPHYLNPVHYYGR